MMSLGDTTSCHLDRLHLVMLDVGGPGPRVSRVVVGEEDESGPG